jgi:DNA-binding transcriptional LysR family regulator
MTLETSASENRTSFIRLATSDSLSDHLLHACFSHIRQQHPGIRINLATAGTDGLFHLLDHNEADLVCTLDSHIYNTNYIIASEEKIGVHFVVSADSPLAKKERLSVDDLKRQSFLLTEKGMSYRRLLDEWLAKASVEIRPVLETGRADLLCSLVELGVGISFLPDYVTEEAATRGTVVRMEAEGFRPELWKQLLYHREKCVSQAMQNVIFLLMDNKGDLR